MTTGKNISGETLPPRSIVALGETKTGRSGTQRYEYIEVDKPAGDPEEIYAVTYELETPDDGLCRLVSPANWPVLVAYDDAETPAVGDFWGPEKDSWKLTKGRGNWKISKVNSTLGLVQATMYPSLIFWVELNEDINQGASGECTILTGITGDTDTGGTATCYNEFDDITAGAKCLATIVNGGINLLAGPCDVASSSGS